jgi:hypothetical protein
LSIFFLKKKKKEIKLSLALLLFFLSLLIMINMKDRQEQESVKPRYDAWSLLEQPTFIEPLVGFDSGFGAKSTLYFLVVGSL